jgi:hypothetical protein
MRIEGRLIVGENYEEEQGGAGAVPGLPLFTNNLGPRKPAT